MHAQDGLYTLVTRAADTDRFGPVSSLSRAHSAADHAAWLGYLAGVPFPAKANLRARWARSADRAAAYVPVPNPFAAR